MGELDGCFSRISVSLYGHDRNSFNAYTGVDGFESVMRSWGVYRRVCRQVCISYIVDRDKLDDLRKVLDLCDTLEPSRLLLYNPLCYDASDKVQMAKIITAQDTEIISTIAELAEGRRYPIDLPPYPDYMTPCNSCRSYCAVINVDGNGDIGGCLRKVVPDAHAVMCSMTRTASIQRPCCGYDADKWWVTRRIPSVLTALATGAMATTIP